MLIGPVGGRAEPARRASERGAIAGHSIAFSWCEIVGSDPSGVRPLPTMMWKSDR
jgi:hypothetical protein